MDQITSDRMDQYSSNRLDQYNPPSTSKDLEYNLEDTDFSLFSSGDPTVTAGIEWWGSGEHPDDSQQLIANGMSVLLPPPPYRAGGSSDIYSWNLPSLENEEPGQTSVEFLENNANIVELQPCQLTELPQASVPSISTAFISCPSCHCNLTCRPSAADPTGVLSLNVSAANSAVNGYCTVVEATTSAATAAVVRSLQQPYTPGVENSLDIETLLVQRQSF